MCLNCIFVNEKLLSNVKINNENNKDHKNGQATWKANQNQIVMLITIWWEKLVQQYDNSCAHKIFSNLSNIFFVVKSVPGFQKL